MEPKTQSQVAPAGAKSQAPVEKEHQVLVHKANIPLAKGESINQYTSRLSEAGRKALIQKLNLNTTYDKTTGTSGASVYLLEAFAKSAIFDVYKYTPGSASTYKYYAVKYDRSETGDFSFSDMTEVERKTSFVPKEEFSMVEKSEDKLSRPPSKSVPVRVADPEVEIWKASGWSQLFSGLL